MQHITFGVCVWWGREKLLWGGNNRRRSKGRCQLTQLNDLSSCCKLSITFLLPHSLWKGTARISHGSNGLFSDNYCIAGCPGPWCPPSLLDSAAHKWFNLDGTNINWLSKPGSMSVMEAATHAHFVNKESTEWANCYLSHFETFLEQKIIIFSLWIAKFKLYS